MSEIHEYAITYYVWDGVTAHQPEAALVRAYTAADAMTQFRVRHRDEDRFRVKRIDPSEEFFGSDRLGERPIAREL